LVASPPHFASASPPELGPRNSPPLLIYNSEKTEANGQTNSRILTCGYAGGSV